MTNSNLEYLNENIIPKFFDIKSNKTYHEALYNSNDGKTLISGYIPPDNSDQILQFVDWSRLLIECLNSDSCNIKKHAIIILANLVNKSEHVKKYLIHNDIFGLDYKLRMSPHKCIVDEYVNLLGNLIF